MVAELQDIQIVLDQSELQHPPGQVGYQLWQLSIKMARNDRNQDRCEGIYVP